MKRVIFILLLVIVPLSLFFVQKQEVQEQGRLWQFAAIDTMKYSRDLSREKLTDGSFDYNINIHVENIARIGATHVAIATPYDEEFVPILRRWVEAARRNNLNVWFRGNWSGWEGWFEYAKIDRETHIEKTKEFILNHPDLFVNGDVFTACPECENGGPGDPRRTGDTDGHRKFLIDEYAVTKQAFYEIGKTVASNYNSMNGDVARLIMDKATTKALDGIVVVDHYVKSTDTLAKDIQALASQSAGKVVLGEYGVPIPDIHGEFSESEQAAWLSDAYKKIALLPELVGLSYWTNVGGSTQLWDASGTPRLAVDVVKQYYSPAVASGTVRDTVGVSVKQGQVKTLGRVFLLSRNGSFTLPVISDDQEILVEAEGFLSSKLIIDKKTEQFVVTLKRENDDLITKIRKKIEQILSSKSN